jgi:hypothetical protein
MSKSPYVVVFAGAQGSSKSIVAHYLSMRFDLPILDRDTIRSEVKEEFLVSNINEPHALEEFEKRFEERWRQALASRQDFILDGSVDRSWPDTKKELQAAGYKWFMVDMELSRSFFVKLFSATDRKDVIAELDRYLSDHKKFMQKYSGDVTVKVTDDTFNQRVHVATNGLREFLAT